MTTSTHIPKRYRVTSVTLPPFSPLHFPSIPLIRPIHTSFFSPIRPIRLISPISPIPKFPQNSIPYVIGQPSNGLATASVKSPYPLAHEFLHFFTSHLSTTLPSPQSNKCNKVTQLCERGTFRHRSYILLMCFRLFCQHIQKLIFRGWGKADVAVLVE